MPLAANTLGCAPIRALRIEMRTIVFNFTLVLKHRTGPTRPPRPDILPPRDFHAFPASSQSANQGLEGVKKMGL